MDATLTEKSREWIAALKETKAASARATQLRKRVKALKGETNKLMQERNLDCIEVDGYTISTHRVADAAPTTT